MNTYAIKETAPGKYFSEPVYLDGNFILAAPEMPLSQEALKALIEWDFREFQSAGTPGDHYQEKAAVAAEAETSVPQNGTDGDHIRRAGDFYRRFCDFVEDLFTRFVTKNEINTKEVSETIKELCDVVKEDRRFLLRIMQEPGRGEGNYLAPHSVKSTIIAVVLGSYIKLPNHRLIELGTAALLHEIGMVQLPPQLYMSDKPLSPPERKAIITHPVLGYNVLRNLSFPLAVCLAALEHHERENGEGYPRKLTSDKISLYAKIISVACSYEALTAKRPHKDAKDGYAGMIEFLKNVGKQYDDTIVRALVFSLSIYPIGLYVLLSNGKKGQVVDVNPESPRFPLVQVFGEKTPDGKDRVIETSQEGVHILRPLVKAEVSQGQTE